MSAMLLVEIQSTTFPPIKSELANKRRLKRAHEPEAIKTVVFITRRG